MTASNETVITELWARFNALSYDYDSGDFKIERFSSNGGKTAAKNGVRISFNNASVRCSLYRSYEGNLIAALKAVIALVESEAK